MSARFAGRVAIVTGAASGIGRATAQRLLDEGARVLAVDVDAATLSWTEGIDNIEVQVGSVATRAGNEAMVARALTLWGRLDVLHLNAGVMPTSSIYVEDLDVFELCLAVNLKAIVHGIRAALPSLRSGGSIVVTNSTSGLAGDAMAWAYNASKAGALNVVRSVAAEVAHTGVRVNAVCPGPILTGAGEQFRAAAPELFEVFRTNVPMRRWAAPEEVAAVVAFLVSDDASYITGVALPVDGGLSCISGLFPLPPEVALV